MKPTKFWGSLLTCFSVLTLLASPLSASDRAEPYLLVQTEVARGSAVHIGEGYAITAAHVINGASKIIVVSTAGTRHVADVIAVSYEQDIALLRVRYPDKLDAIPLACDADPPVGLEIEAHGNPRTANFVTTYGRVSSEVQEIATWKHVFLSDVRVDHGMSGGAAVSNGEVVGIIVAMQGEGGIALIVPSTAVCDFID